MKKACVFLADGFEEIEGLTVVDVLRRAGVDVKTVSVMNTKRIEGSHGIILEADEQFEEAEMEDVDLLVLPGGLPGTWHLRDHKGLTELIRSFDKKEKRIAAICAAPSVFGGMGLLKGRKACSYPSMEDQLDGAEVVHTPFVSDGHITTGRGMGAALPFALELTALLCGKEKADEIAESIVYVG